MFSGKYIAHILFPEGVIFRKVYDITYIIYFFSFSTREEHRLSSTEEQRNDDFIFLDDDADGLVDVQQHKDLLRQFALYEIGRKGDPVCAFRGQLPDLALLILHQHAIQSDLTELHQMMWLEKI